MFAKSVRFVVRAGGAAVADCTFALAGQQFVAHSVVSLGEYDVALPIGEQRDLAVTVTASGRVPTTVTVGRGVREVQVEFAVGGSVAGRVVTASGVPVVGGFVRVAGRQTRTGTSGEFEMTDLPPGRYAGFEVLRSGGTAFVSYPFELRVAGGSARADVVLPNASPLRLVLRWRGTTDPVSGVGVRVVDALSGGTLASDAVSDFSGRAVVDIASDGPFSVATWGGGSEPGAMSNVRRLGDRDVVIEVDRVADHRIALTVVDAARAAVAGAVVGWTVEGVQHESTTDSSGRAHVTELRRRARSGKGVRPLDGAVSLVHVSVRKSGFAPAYWSLPFDTDATVTLGRATRVRGRVTDATGAALPGFQVFMRGDDGAVSSKAFEGGRGGASRREFVWDGAPGVAGIVEIFADDGRRCVARFDPTGQADVDLGDLELPACGRVRWATDTVPAPGVAACVAWFNDDGELDGAAGFVRNLEWTTSAIVPTGSHRAALFVEGCLPADLGVLEIIAGRTTTVNVEPGRCGSVAVVVTDGGSPVEGVVVEAEFERASPLVRRWRDARSVDFGGRVRRYDPATVSLRPTTDAFGRAEIHRLVPGRTRLIVSRDGATVATANVDVESGVATMVGIEVGDGK